MIFRIIINQRDNELQFHASGGMKARLYEYTSVYLSLTFVHFCNLAFIGVKFQFFLLLLLLSFRLRYVLHANFE